MQIQKNRQTEKALENLEKSAPKPQENVQAPSEQRRRKFQPISGQIKARIVDEILYKGTMSWSDAEKAFDVSHASIGRILDQEKKRKNPDSQSEPPKVA